MRQPAWTRDEIILALDVYLRNIRVRPITTANEDVMSLSRLLNELPIHSKEKRGLSFRNPDGVKMEVLNFISLDPQHSGKGLCNIGKQHEAVWGDFADQREYLHQVASAIVACHPLPFQYSFRPDLDQMSFFEGSILYQYHRHIEIETDADRFEHLPRECSICGFVFGQAFGELGEGFIEFHYFRPPVEYENGLEVRDEDFGSVCSNCHRMLHRRRHWLVKAERVRLIQR